MMETQPNKDWMRGTLSSGTATQLVTESVWKLTLHPAHPLFGLLAIQKADVVVGALHGEQPYCETSQHEEGENPSIKLVLFLQPKRCSISEICDADCSAENKAREFVVPHYGKP